MNAQEFMQQQQKINSSLLKNVQSLMDENEDLRAENQRIIERIERLEKKSNN